MTSSDCNRYNRTLKAREWNLKVQKFVLESMESSYGKYAISGFLMEEGIPL